jgi:hypothetical protein
MGRLPLRMAQVRRGALSLADRKSLVAEYATGTRIKPLAEKYGVSLSTIDYHIRLANVPMHPRAGKLTADHRAQLVAEYEGGASAATVARKYGVSQVGALRHIRARVPRETRVGRMFRTAFKPGRRPASAPRRGAVAAVFDVVTEDVAYWVGFLMADGCVSDLGRITLNLAERDAGHVESFRAFLGLDHRIKTRPARGWGGPQTVLSFGSVDMARRLASYGVVPRKGSFAAVIGLENDRHFWRGMIDGDGWITGGGKHPVIGLAGNAALMRQYVSFVRSILPECDRQPRAVGKIFEFRDYDEPTGPARQSYDPASQLGMYRAPGGRRIIPTINTASRGTDVHTDEPGMGRYGVPALPMAPRPPSVGLPATAGPADAGNRFGSTNAFQDSVNRGRALRQYQAGSHVDNLTRGQNEQEAARNAYAQTQLAGANMQTGGFFQGYGNSRDANSRANEQSDAGVRFSDSQTGVNSAIAKSGIPAQANETNSRADINRAGVRASDQLLPGQVAGQGIANKSRRRGRVRRPGRRRRREQQKAQTEATRLSGVDVKTLQKRLEDQQRYIDHLQTLLVPARRQPDGTCGVQSRVQARPTGAPAGPARRRTGDAAGRGGTRRDDAAQRTGRDQPADGPARPVERHGVGSDPVDE